jgi:competence protein ComEA
VSEGGRRQTLAWAAVAALVVFAGAKVLGGGGGPGDAGPPVRVESEGAPARTGVRRTPARMLYVHVAGAVRRPGLYRVPAGARVAAAVARAGGAARGGDLTAVNLAARVADGQQVIVPRAGAAAAAGPPAAGGAGAAVAGAVKPSLATATVEQLDALDGIGPALAKRIVDYRTQHGGFRSIGQLQEVSGIGEKRFEALKEALAP